MKCAKLAMAVLLGATMFLSGCAVYTPAPRPYYATETYVYAPPPPPPVVYYRGGWGGGWHHRGYWR